MTHPSGPEVEQLFHRALDLDGPARERFLDEACGSDRAKREAVERLLAAADAGTPLAEPLRRDVESLSTHAHDLLGTKIGPYELVARIGEGGFGEVYAADQKEPLRRRVALKILKAGLDTTAVLARFEAERQALAVMDHPAIASVHDAGRTERGRPYVVMELVEGEPVTTYCDRERLSIRERLELFTIICRGVQHAHQKGVIHRDLKPSNVLVAAVDGKPVPKIIDFGIAKATHASLTEHTIHTELGHHIGTPAYMSPEQAGATGGDVDTRSDIYSLGVLLYEILTGALPFDPAELRAGGAAELQRALRDRDPKRPSTQVTRGQNSPSLAAARRAPDARALSRRLRGDLDWIVLKSMEKDRERRYESAEAFAADIRRHLDDEPVVAGPPTFRYRAGKFARRHRVALGVVAVIAMSLGYALFESNRQRARAELARDESEAVTDFLAGMLGAADPAEEDKDVTVREVLDRAASTVSDEFAGRPRIRSRLTATIGSAYRDLGHLDDAERMLETALAVRESTLDGDDERLAESLGDLAELLFQTGAYARAESLRLREIEVLRRALGPESATLATATTGLANVYWKTGDFPNARARFEETLAVREKLLGPDHADLAGGLTNLAIVVEEMGDLETAASHHARAIRILEETKGSDHLWVGYAANNFAILRKKMGDYDEAKALYLRARAIWEATLGPDHHLVAACISNLGILLRDTGDLEGAEPLLVEALQIRERTLGEDHADVASSLNALALLHLAREDPATARPLMERALSIREHALGPEHPRVASSLEDLADLCVAEHRPGAARELLERAYEINRTKLGDEHHAVGVTLHKMAKLDGETGHAARAESRYREATEILHASLGADHPFARENVDRHAALLRELGRHAEAESLAAADDLSR